MPGEEKEERETVHIGCKPSEAIFGSRIHGHRIGREKMAVRREREFSFPRLVVIFVLLSSRPRNLLSYLVFFTPTKRYQEVDGVRKEKERLTTDFSSLSLSSSCGLSVSYFQEDHRWKQRKRKRRKKENDVGVPLAQRIFPLLLARRLSEGWS